MSVVICDTLVEAILDGILGGTAIPLEATWYIAALTAEPDADGTNYTEATGGSYARVNKTNNGTNFPAATSGTRLKENGAIVTFPTASAGWGAITHIGFFNVSPAGTGVCQLCLELPTPQTINNGNTLAFAIGELELGAV